MMACLTPDFGRGHTGSRAGRRAQGGMALIMVLWVVTLLTVIASSFTLGMRREAGTIQNMIEMAEGRTIAEAGVRMAMLGLEHPVEDERWETDGRIRTLNWQSAELRVRVTDVSARIDINLAGRELLDGALRQAGMEDSGAREALLDNLLDWRDPSPHRRAEGLGDAGYHAAGLPYGPYNGPFRTVEELLLVPGMTPAVYRRLESMVTVHSRRAQVHAASAPRDVLLALPGLDAGVVDGFLEQRARAHEQREPVPALAGVELGQSSGVAYTVESSARLASGFEYRIEVDMAPASDHGREPYRIIRYRMGGVSAPD